MRELQAYAAPTPLKLSALWTATMFCYVYGDYFGMYVAGKLAGMASGTMGPLGPATPGVLVGVSLMMAVPSVMIALSLLLPAPASRWSNVVLGLAYTGIMAMTWPGAPAFYQTLAVIEMALTLGIAGIAWRWPAAEGTAA